ncbi:hypothetical protein B1A_05287, partial [mine drainage metagenome]
LTRRARARLGDRQRRVRGNRHAQHLQATLLAMRRALLALAVRPAHVCIDGNRAPPLADLGCTVETIIGGDALVPAISAASILAKTHRDALMRVLERSHPGLLASRDTRAMAPRRTSRRCAGSDPRASIGCRLRRCARRRRSSRPRRTPRFPRGRARAGIERHGRRVRPSAPAHRVFAARQRRARAATDRGGGRRGHAGRGGDRPE